MGKKKLYSQSRTIDVEITNLVSVDIDLLKLRLNSLPKDQLLEKIESYWTHYVDGCFEDNCKKCNIAEEAFKLAGVYSKIIPNSLRVRSQEALSEEEEDDS